MIEVKKRDKLKVFSIIGAILLLVYVALLVCKSFAETGMNLFVNWFYYGGLSVSELSDYFSGDFVGLSFVLLVIVAALIIFINKNSSAVFIPMGLLTYSLFSIFVGIAVSFFLKTFMGPTGEFYFGEFVLEISLNEMSKYLTFVISMLCALPVTIFFCVASLTFMKKVKAVLMFLLFGAFAIGLLLSVVLTISNTIIILTSDLPLLNNFMGLSTIIFVYASFISPFIAHGFRLVFLAGLAFACIGMCSSPKVIVSADEAADAEPSTAEVAESAEVTQ